MGTFRRVRASEFLLAAGALLAVLAALAALFRARRPRELPPGAVRAAHAIPEAFGDAVLVADADGRIVDASEDALRLAGEPLVGRTLADLGPDLPVLAKGLGHGPASSRVTVAFAAGRVVARAALVRVSERPARDVVALRPERAPRATAPPLPAATPPPLPRSGADRASVAAEARAVVAAAAAALRDPLARAARAASLLRLRTPASAGPAADALADLERALEDAGRRVAALAAAGQPGARRAVDLGALVEDLAAAFAPPPGVRLRVIGGAARVHADERPLRAALREVLHAAADALPAGGDVVVAVSSAQAGPVLEVSLGAAPAGSLAALARALLAPQGAHVEEVARPAGGASVRVLLPAPPREEEAGIRLEAPGYSSAPS